MERPRKIDKSISVFGDYLRAWVVVYDDFLRTYNFKEDDLRIEEYVASFFEEDETIVIFVGRNRLASDSFGLEKSIIYRVHKNNFKLVEKKLLR